jgi:RecA-family ATPase
MGLVQPLRPFRDFSPIEWQGQSSPRTEWVLDGVIMRKTVCLFSGKGGVGKSLLMQQLMTAAALGRPWMGIDVAPCRTFGIFAEDPKAELWRRQERINRYYDVDQGDLEDMRMVSIDEADDVALYRTSKAYPNGAPTMLFNQMINRIIETGTQLVVIDNVAAVFEANENYKEHVRPFFQTLIKLAKDIDGAVILCQHPSKDGNTQSTGLSGSQLWHSTARAQMFLHLPKEANEEETPCDERVLRFGKANYGKRGVPLRLEWSSEFNLFVPTLAPKQDGRLDTVDWLELRSNIDRCLTERIKVGESFSLSKQTKLNVASQLRKEKAWQRYTWQEIMDACASMLRDGKLVQVQIGPPSKREVRIRPAGVTYPGEAR